MILGETLEVDQDLHHLLDEHLLEVLVSPHELDEDHGVPGLAPLQIVGIVEDAGPGLVSLITAILREGSSRSQEAPGDQDLKENLTVPTIVKLVAGGVKKLEHSIEVNPDLERSQL